MIWSLRSLIRHAKENQTERNGKWVPAKPIKAKRFHVREAWEVLIGKADAFYWPEDKDNDHLAVEEEK